MSTILINANTPKLRIANMIQVMKNAPANYLATFDVMNALCLLNGRLRRNNNARDNLYNSWLYRCMCLCGT